MTAKQGRCSAVQIADFRAACFGGSASACQAFVDTNANCAACVLGPQVGEDVATATTPVFVPFGGEALVPNVRACEALAANAGEVCAQAFSNQLFCSGRACAACSADSPELEACATYAVSAACRVYAPAVECERAIAADAARAQATCASNAATLEEVFDAMVPFICGDASGQP